MKKFVIIAFLIITMVGVAGCGKKAHKPYFENGCAYVSYQIQPGETFYGICQKFVDENHTWQEYAGLVMRVNGLKKKEIDLIYAYNYIILPVDKSCYEQYKKMCE